MDWIHLEDHFYKTKRIFCDFRFWFLLIKTLAKRVIKKRHIWKHTKICLHICGCHRRFSSAYTCAVWAVFAVRLTKHYQLSIKRVPYEDWLDAQMCSLIRVFVGRTCTFSHVSVLPDSFWNVSIICVRRNKITKRLCEYVGRSVCLLIS